MILIFAEHTTIIQEESWNNTIYIKKECNQPALTASRIKVMATKLFFGRSEYKYIWVPGFNKGIQPFPKN
jgi:hypothetical protein